MIKLKPVSDVGFDVATSPANDDYFARPGSRHWISAGLERSAANDDWGGAGIPSDLPILMEEVLLLDSMLRREIHALFDRNEM